MTIEIKDRWTSRVLYSSQTAKTLREAILEAVKNRAYLGGADLGGADLGGAYLGGAYLGGANLRGADLGGAYLGGAYLGGAYLGGAYLGGAYLGGALGGANFRGAYLGGAEGLVPQYVQPLLMLLDQPGKLRAYKIVRQNGEGIYNGGLVYEVGKKYSVDNANTDINEECGAGLHVATLDWCLREWKEGYRIIQVEFTANDIAAIPTAGNGKFRLHRLKVVREMTEEETGIAQMKRDQEEARKAIEERNKANAN